LIGDGFAMLELGTEEPLVGVDSLIKVVDSHTKVMDSSRRHRSMLSTTYAHPTQTCHHRVMRLRALVTAAAVAALLAGCGGSSNTPTTPATSTAEITTTPTHLAPLPNGEAGKFADTIVDDAIAAANASKGVHIVGDVSNAGKPLKLNLNLVTGKGGSGTVTTNGLTFQIIRIGTKAYFKAGSAFWSHFGESGLGAQLDNRWIEASATSGDLASFTPLTDVTEVFTSVLGSHGPLEKAAGNVTDNGEAAIAIVDSGLGSTLLVAANGTPYPLGLEEKGGGVVTFSDWDRPVALQAPKNAVQLDKLKPG